MEVPISRARQNLFAYFDQAVRQEGAKIFIARRGQKQRAVLVSAGYLAALENRSTLKPADGNRGPKFHMAGSARIIGDPETVISDVRAWQKKLQRQKEQRWAKEFRKHGQAAGRDCAGTGLPAAHPRPRHSRQPPGADDLVIF